MAQAIIMVGGNGGDGSDECNVTTNYVVKGKTYIGADTNDEVGTGTLELTGNATNAEVLTGKTYYNTNPHQKNTGTMANRTNATTTWCGYETVTVQAHPSDPNNQALVTVPMTNSAIGYYDNTSSVTSNIRNLVAANIKTGVLVGRTGGTTSNCVAGTFTSDANATASQILSGYTAYVSGNKVTGTVAVQSILSFSAAVYSSTAITFTWQNPAKGAFSGVIIVGKTGSYPTSISDGTRYYKGYGSNSSASGTSTTTVSGFASGTTYYFRAYSYATKDSAEWVHGTSYTGTASTTKGLVALTSSGTWTVPTGVRSIDVCCIGGGSGGNAGENYYSNTGTPWFSGGGGGGGYVVTSKNIAVTPGTQYSAVVGTGGTGGRFQNRAGGAGGTSSLGSLVSAAGGATGTFGIGHNGGSGGGGGSPVSTNYSNNYGGDGGTDGGNGSISSGSSSLGYGLGGTGQGTTTRAFGESSNTLYSGGGGGGGGSVRTGTSDGEEYGMSIGGLGGSGGGGFGAGNMNVSAGRSGQNASNGTASTGGGGGGGCRGRSQSIDGSYSDRLAGGDGGSGIVLIRWGY